MKRVLTILAIVFSTLVLFIVFGMWAVKKGISPLVNHEVLQNGAVTVVVDETSPMPVAAYLLRLQDGSLALVDAGMDPEAKAIQKALQRLGLPESAVGAILFTHTHSDHTAGARRFPAASLYALEPLPRPPSDKAPLDPANAQGRPRRREIHRLRDSEILDLHGTRIEVFALRGHTYDSCAYLAHGVLFMGDSAAGQYNGNIGGAPPFVSSDRPMNRIELKRLAQRLQGRKSEIAHMAFGHQGPLKGLDPLLRWAASH